MKLFTSWLLIMLAGVLLIGGAPVDGVRYGSGGSALATNPARGG